MAYVIGTYPTLTTTFIDREIEALYQHGIDLRLVSIRHPVASEQSLGGGGIAKRLWYLLPAGWWQVLRAHLRWALKQPGLFFALPIYLLTRPHPSFRARVKTFFHFVEGVLAADHLRDQGAAHIHAHFADRAAVVALVAARLLNVSYSLFAHANDIYVDPVLLPEKIQHASFVATCTNYNRAHLAALAANHQPRPIELLYHGLDLPRFRPPQQRPPGQHRLLSVGRLHEKKGYAYLIRACRQLYDRGCVFTCDIIGDGPQRSQLQTLIDELGLVDIVRLHGSLAHRQVLAYYEKASAFALACVVATNDDRDGIPNVFLEAMAMRVPVVGTRLSGIPELIKDGVNGLLVPSRDANALADAIARLWDNPSLATRLAGAGRATVERDYDIQQNVQRLAKLFERCLPSKVAAAPGVEASEKVIL
ncbi:MAG: glycosyltransferase [Anaerolineae bacterium]|nr:MAG: glycosyltransferase [Anaerolineae bacterium]